MPTKLKKLVRAHMAETGKSYQSALRYIRGIQDKKEDTVLSREMLQQMIAELDEGSFAILDEKDREFVEGVKMLLRMDEAVSNEAVQRIKDIYDKFKRDMHLAMQPKG
jgi:hypothetical protein